MNTFLKLSRRFPRGLYRRSFAEMGHSGDFKNQIKVAPAAAAGSTAISGNIIGDPKSPWQPTKDPNGGPGVYYWNTDTNETTSVGAPKPAHWVEVHNDNNISYWWNPETNSTTAVGAPKPHHSQIVAHTAGDTGGGLGAQQVGTSTFGGMMKTYVLLGVGVACGSMVVRAVFGF